MTASNVGDELREWVASVRAKFRLPPHATADGDGYWNGYAAALDDVDRAAEYVRLAGATPAPAFIAEARQHIVKARDWLRDGESSYVEDELALAERVLNLQSQALARATPAPALDIERLAKAYHNSHQAHRFEDCEFQDQARDHARSIAAEYVRLATDPPAPGEPDKDWKPVDPAEREHWQSETP